MQNGKWFWRVLGKTFCVIRWKLLGVSFLGQILKVHDKVLKTELRLHVDQDDPITRNLSSFLFYDNIFSQIIKQDLKIRRIARNLSFQSELTGQEM